MEIHSEGQHGPAIKSQQPFLTIAYLLSVHLQITTVWRLAWQKIEELGILPSNLNVTWKTYDDRCDASYALISAMDGHFKDCADVIFGPVCDYALGETEIHFTL